MSPPAENMFHATWCMHIHLRWRFVKASGASVHAAARCRDVRLDRVGERCLLRQQPRPLLHSATLHYHPLSSTHLRCLQPSCCRDGFHWGARLETSHRLGRPACQEPTMTLGTLHPTLPAWSSFSWQGAGRRQQQGPSLVDRHRMVGEADRHQLFVSYRATTCPGPACLGAVVPVSECLTNPQI